MENILTTQNILFVITIAGVIFSIYRSYRTPQEETETKIAVGEERDKNKATVLAQKEMENKASLLDQAVKLERESNDKRFNELAANFKDAMTLAQNHIHTVDTKIDSLTTKFNTLENSVTKLGTIIEERIPKR